MLYQKNIFKGKIKMFKYAVYDENNELMRKTKTYAHAKYLCSIRSGWYCRKIKSVLPTFEDALF